MQLKTADVFGRGGGDIFGPEKLLEFIHVVSVSVDGVDRKIADLHVLHHANADWRMMFLMRCHAGVLWSWVFTGKTPACLKEPKAQVLTTKTFVTIGHGTTRCKGQDSQHAGPRIAASSQPAAGETAQSPA